MSAPPSQVVIVGRDAALWLAAASLRKALAPAGVSVTAIELPSHASAASAHVAMPAIEALHTRIGLDEATLLRTTGGSFSLGCNVVAADRGTAPFFIAHGTYGTAIDGNDFFPYWLKARQFGLGAALEDFSPTAMAARHGRVMLPDEETAAFGRTDYGYHLPARPYSGVLKGLAHGLGVAIHQAMAVTIDRDAAGGAIRAVRPDGGAPIVGDLFVDASGSDALLIGDAPGAGWEDWRRHFPFDRRLDARGPRFASVPPYAELRHGAGGWTALHAARAATYVVHCYAAAQTDTAAFADAAARAGLTLADAAVTTIAPGRRTAGWAGNCVAIGSAACVLDPLLDLDLHVAQLGIVHLLSLFPASCDPAAERAEYNRITASLFERLRDFQAAFHARSMAVEMPEMLAHRIAAFRARGIIAPMEDDSFSADQWRALFVGSGLPAESWPPAIDTTPPERIKQGLRDTLGFVGRKVREQPTHDSYLAELCDGAVA